MKQLLLVGKTAKGAVTLVDDDDYEALKDIRWNLSAFGYAVHRQWLKKEKKYVTLWLHRLINKTPDHLQTDHINGNRLDNRKENLRSCTPKQNQGNSGRNKNNTSGYRGVSGKRGKWRAYISDSGRFIHIGTFVTKEEAAEAYNATAQKLFGDYSTKNYVPSTV